MRRFVASAVVFVLLASSASAQSKRYKVYDGYYDGHRYRPGLTINSDMTWTEQYLSGSKTYHFGYQPPRAAQRRSPTVPQGRVNRYRSYGSGKPIYGGSTYGLAPRDEYFFYEGMHMTPYNIFSPVWD